MKVKKILWGLFFLLIGTIIIVNRLGYLEIGNLFSFVVAMLLVPVFVKGILSVNFPAILFPLAIVGILYSEELGITNITPWPILLTALFGSIGLSLIFGKHEHFGCFCNISKGQTYVNGDEDLDIDVNFNEVIKYVDSSDFKKGKIDCSFGSAKVYFDKATLNKDGAIVDLDVSFGGVELFIPKEWKVVNNVKIFAGGVDEKNRPNENSDKKITLTGEINFSGVTIIYI